MKKQNFLAQRLHSQSAQLYSSLFHWTRQMTTDRRTPTRVRVRWPVVLLTAKGVVLAETRDISSHGAFIQCKLPLPPKEKLRLFIMTPDQRPLDVPAEVAWSNPYGSEHDSVPRGVGVRFTKISRDNRQCLRNVLANHYQRKTSNIAEGE